MTLFFNKVTIIGVGLIGGSLAKLMKAQKLCGEIHGAGRSRETLEQAVKLGVIDHMGRGSAHAVEHADLVVLATPVGTFESIVREIAPHLKNGTILTDVGSVKGGLVRTIEGLLPPGVHFVPGHPIAGREKHGVGAASEDLFRGAKCIITPTEKTDAKALEAVTALWTKAGMNVVMMEPEQHDHIFAAVSHLPHAAAYAMVSTVAEFSAGADNYTTFSGAGFRDFTRIAASDPTMWRDIFLNNREALLEMLARFMEDAQAMSRAVRWGDEAYIVKRIEEGRKIRRSLIEMKQA